MPNRRHIAMLPTDERSSALPPSTALIAATIMALIMGLITGPVAASMQSDPRGADVRSVPETGPAGPAVPAAGSEAPPRMMPVPIRRILVGGPAVLFPEGTYLIRTPGRLFPEADDGLWKFLPDDFGGAVPRAVPLAPSPALEQVVSVTIPEQGLDVEVSGEVLAYRGSNWILPELVVPVVRTTPRPAARPSPPEPRPPGEGAEAPTGTGVASGASTGTRAAPADDATPASDGVPGEVPRGDGTEMSSAGEPAAAADPTPASTPVGASDASAAPPVPPAPSEESTTIEQMLRARIGGVAQSIEVLPVREIALPEVSIGVGGVGLEGAIDSGPAPPAEALIVTRRGTIVRDNDRGGWRFVSVTEDGGNPEPSMRLVPSVVLERVERTVRAADGPIPILVTGRVLRFRDERWLRLTAWELPRTGRSLQPG